MATYFVGQRVRVKWVWKQENAHLVGLEGRINEVRPLLAPPGCLYGLDVSPIHREIGDGGRLNECGFRADQLAPILPEGQQPCGESYEELMSRLREEVAA